MNVNSGFGSLVGFAGLGAPGVGQLDPLGAYGLHAGGHSNAGAFTGSFPGSALEGVGDASLLGGGPSNLGQHHQHRHQLDTTGNHHPLDANDDGNMDDDSDDDEQSRGSKRSRSKKPHLQGRFSGRLATKEDERRLAEECRMLGPLLGGIGKRGDKSRLTLAKIVRGIATGDIRRHCEERERGLQVLRTRLSQWEQNPTLLNNLRSENAALRAEVQRLRHMQSMQMPTDLLQQAGLPLLHSQLVQSGPQQLHHQLQQALQQQEQEQRQQRLQQQQQQLQFMQPSGLDLHRHSSLPPQQQQRERASGRAKADADGDSNEDGATDDEVGAGGHAIDDQDAAARKSNGNARGGSRGAQLSRKSASGGSTLGTAPALMTGFAGLPHSQKLFGNQLPIPALSGPVDPIATYQQQLQQQVQLEISTIQSTVEHLQTMQAMQNQVESLQRQGTGQQPSPRFLGAGNGPRDNEALQASLVSSGLLAAMAGAGQRGGGGEQRGSRGDADAEQVAERKPAGSAVATSGTQREPHQGTPADTEDAQGDASKAND